MTRKEKGRQIAGEGNIRKNHDGEWVVLSQTKPRTRYHVNLEKRTCTCGDFDTWALDCKHIWAAHFFVGGHATVAKEKRLPAAKYSQDWPAYNAAQIGEQDHFEVILRTLCSNVRQPHQCMGRPRLPLKDVIYASATKVYSLKSGRRASSMIRTCEHKGHIAKAPHHNSLSHYLLMPELTPLLHSLIKKSAQPLQALESQFAVDSTGFSTRIYDRWYDHKYGIPGAVEVRTQRWLKCHAMVGTRTNVVASVEVTRSNVADVTQLETLVASTAQRFDVAEVSADKAYLSADNLEVIEEHGARPFVPFKAASRAGKTPAWQKMWHLFWLHRDQFLESYHKRSNVETTFHMIKAKFGGSLRSKKFTSQVNEVLLKVLAHNIVVLIHESAELGIDVREFLGS